MILKSATAVYDSLKKWDVIDDGLVFNVCACSAGFHLVLELLHDVLHGPVLPAARPVTLSKLKVCIEVLHAAAPQLLLPVQDDRLVLKNTQKQNALIHAKGTTRKPAHAI